MDLNVNRKIQNKRFKGRKLSGLLLLSLAFLIGCPQHVKVADINRDPGRYQNKEVALSGTVAESFGFMGQGAFELDDGSGKIWVLSENYGTPSKSTRVGIVGRPVGGITFGTRSFASAIRLTQKPHY
jgi:hypothetical protein